MICRRMTRGTEGAPPATLADTALPWWEQRGVMAALVLAAAIPLLYPPIPPLVDLFGHMGRYRVELDLAHSPWLQRYYEYHWEAIGNLGVDLLVMPAGQAGRARAGGEADCPDDPAVDGRWFPVGRTRGSRAHSAHRLVRFALCLRPPVHVRIRQFRSVDGACLFGIRAVASPRPARANAAAGDPVRADLPDRLLLSHLRLGRTRPAVLLGRGRPPARPRNRLVQGGHPGRAHASVMALPIVIMLGLAERRPRRLDLGLVRLERQMGLGEDGAARSLAVV